ncbi:TPA: replication initiator protein A [Clostridium perfringens]|nr:DNA replication protein [Clostridium phage phiCp-D]
MSRITVTEINRVKFYQVPKAFFHNPKYLSMNSDAKLAYALLRDLLELSVSYKWFNEKGEIYVKLSREKLMLRLNIKGTQKMTKIMNELKQFGLIEEEQVGLNKCNEIYICTPENLSELYDDKDLLEHKKVDKNKKKSGVLKIKSPVKTSNFNGVLKIKSQEFRKSKVKTFENQRHTNTKHTKTKFSSSSIENVMEEITYLFNNVFNKKPTPNMIKKLEVLINKTDKEFILAVLEYAANHNANTPAYFFKTINKFIDKGIVNVADLEASITSFYNDKEKVSNESKGNSKKKTKVNFTQRDDYNYEEFEEVLSGVTGNETIPSQSEIEKMLEGLKA